MVRPWSAAVGTRWNVTRIGRASDHCATRLSPECCSRAGHHPHLIARSGRDPLALYHARPLCAGSDNPDSMHAIGAGLGVLMRREDAAARAERLAVLKRADRLSTIPNPALFERLHNPGKPWEDRRSTDAVLTQEPQQGRGLLLWQRQESHHRVGMA